MAMSPNPQQHRTITRISATFHMTYLTILYSLTINSKHTVTLFHFLKNPLLDGHCFLNTGHKVIGNDQMTIMERKLN